MKYLKRKNKINGFVFQAMPVVQWEGEKFNDVQIINFQQQTCKL